MIDRMEAALIRFDTSLACRNIENPFQHAKADCYRLPMLSHLNA